MKLEKILSPAARKQMTLIALFGAALLSFGASFVAAQTSVFDRTGQIRAVVSETETEVARRQNIFDDGGFTFSGAGGADTKFYFAYPIHDGGKLVEKWVALPEDARWSRLSNRPARVSGVLENNQLKNASASLLSASSEDYASSPPPTVGLYKVVVVPLTIQTSAGRTTNGKTAANLSATPEAIRQNLFNAPDAVNKFYLEASYQKFGFTGVHHPQADVVPVTIQATIAANCQEQIVTEFTPVVRQRLREQNIETTDGSVDLGVIIFNDTPGCPPYPFATRGALGQRGVPQWLWMPESWFVTGPLILAHEIGHTLGGNHPLSLRCANFDDPQTCVAADAADRDIMTSGGRFYQMPNNYERRRWGWHPPGAFDHAATGAVGMFDLHSPILPAIKDGFKRGRFYFRNLNGAFPEWDVYPEARRSWGRFERYREADEPFRSGIAVRIGHRNYADPDAFSILIDPNATAEVEDAPLLVNEQVALGGIVIKCLREHNPQRGTRMKIQE